MKKRTRSIARSVKVKVKGYLFYFKKRTRSIARSVKVIVKGYV